MQVMLIMAGGMVRPIPYNPFMMPAFLKQVPMMYWDAGRDKVAFTFFQELTVKELCIKYPES